MHSPAGPSPAATDPFWSADIWKRGAARAVVTGTAVVVISCGRLFLSPSTQHVSEFPQSPDCVTNRFLHRMPISSSLTQTPGSEIPREGLHVLKSFIRTSGSELMSKRSLVDSNLIGGDSVDCPKELTTGTVEFVTASSRQHDDFNPQTMDFVTVFPTHNWMTLSSLTHTPKRKPFCVDAHGLKVVFVAFLSTVGSETPAESLVTGLSIALFSLTVTIFLGLFLTVDFGTLVDPSVTGWPSMYASGFSHAGSKSGSGGTVVTLNSFWYSSQSPICGPTPSAE